jgi:hypothetical protein
MDRELSGIYVRVETDRVPPETGKMWVNKDITDCTEKEIKRILEKRDQEELVNWLVRIAKLYNTMLNASDIEIPEDLVAECIPKGSEQDILKMIVILCKIYKKTGDVFDIRRAEPTDSLK